jgi:glutamate carboxypeptidase
MRNLFYQLVVLALALAPFRVEADDSAAMVLLQKFVAISSGTGDIGGVKAVQDLVAEQLRAMGFSVEFRPATDGSKRVLLEATLNGTDPRFITFVGHADTVFEVPNPYVKSLDGKIAKGSGVADDKGGLVVGLLALKDFLAKGKPKFSLRFVVSSAEEIGSPGFQDEFKRLGKDSTLVIGLEPALPNGSIISSRKGVRWYDIQVAGKEAHAGVDHASGLNACWELSRKIDKVQSLTDYKKGSTVSVGHMGGGKDKYNIVCGLASAKIDVRFTDIATGQALFKKIETIMQTSLTPANKDGERTHTEYTVIVDVPPFQVSKNSQPLMDAALKAMAGLEGHASKAEATGGAADLNFMDRPGILMVDGMGPIGGGYHTSDEFVDVGSFQTRIAALKALLENAGQTIK